MEKISVIVPVYNSEKYLTKCLDSLVNQTYENIEIIAVNDGSTDNSCDILKSYQEKYFKIFKYYSWDNHGIGATRNKGLELATGDFVGFVDSDDYLELNMYEDMMLQIKNNNADGCICNIRKFNENGTCGEIITECDKDIFSLLDEPENVNKIDYGPCNKLFKRELFDNLEFSVDYKYEDLIPVFMALLNAKKITINDKLLYNYYMNDLGETRTVNERNLDMYYIIKELLDKCFKYKDNISFWKNLEFFCVYRIYEIYGCLLNTKYNYLLKEYINKSIDLLRIYFGDFTNSINGGFIKRKLLGTKLICNILIIVKRGKLDG